MSLEARRDYQESCTRCSQCKFVPMPESQQFSSICPSIDYGDFHAFSGGGKVITSYMLRENVAPVTPKVVESIYACTMCGACDTACKTNMGDEVEPLDTIYELRRHMASKGHVPPALVSLIEAVRREGSHLGVRQDRSLWAAGLGVKDATRETVDVLLHVDGDNAYDSAQWPYLQALAAMLMKAGVNFGIAYDQECDSGALPFELGFRSDALKLAEQQQALLGKSGARTLLTAGAGAFAAFRNYYPRLGVDLGGVRLVHATEYVAELLSAGRLKLSASADIRATYHDPCSLGRLSEPYKPWSGGRTTVMNTLIVPDSPRPQRFGREGQYEAPRELLRQIDHLELVEMERNRRFGFCCGAGAGAAEAYPEMGVKAGVTRLQEAVKTGATHLVTSCASCQRHLAATAKSQGITIEVCGVFDLLCNSVVEG